MLNCPINVISDLCQERFSEEKVNALLNCAMYSEEKVNTLLNSAMLHD